MAEPTNKPNPAKGAKAEANRLMASLLERVPKGFGGSSMGKFDDFRRWLATELDLGDFKDATYAVGSAGIAHNFGSRWTQNNRFAGERVPLGIAFLSVPKGEDEDDLAEKALHTNSKFVNGLRPTSYEAILLFLQPAGETTLRAHSIQTVAGSAVAAKLQKLFPQADLRVVDWEGGAASHGQHPTRGERTRPLHSSGEAILRPLDTDLLDELEEAFAEANYRASAGLAERVVSALAAKPFLILAGLSGSGKTLLAIAISRWLAASPEQVEVVAVGADWTTSQHLLGYPDALDPQRFARTPCLDLLVRATEKPSHPHFLILDEMNLSHVERYFSDFLSAMESHEPLSLHPGPEPRDGAPARLALPRNLFVIGTVNVDETTYMFSPKVIDRANVVEFTVTAAAMEAYLDGDTEFLAEELAGGGSAFGASLVDFVQDAALLSALAEDEAARFRQLTLDLFSTLDAAGVQFGFRTAREMIRYGVANKMLAGESWTVEKAFDAQIAQRILPRMNGDAGKLRPPLLSLLALMDATVSDVDAGLDGVRSKVADLSLLDAAATTAFGAGLSGAFPLSASKVARMLARLGTHGFATAIEA